MNGKYPKNRHYGTKKKLLLVGAGHAHLQVLKSMRRKRWPETEVTLISPSRFQYYSGMFSGLIEGHYTLDEVRIDVKRLTAPAGIRFVEASVRNVLPVERKVVTDKGDTVPYDVLSFDIGSLTADYGIPGVREYARSLKPVHRLPDVLPELISQKRVVVVGGGASGVEIALALQARRSETNGGLLPVTLITSGRWLEKEPKRGSKIAERVLRQRSVNAIPFSPVNGVREDRLDISGGKTIPYDQLLWLAGPAPHPLFKKSGLPVDQNGYLSVKEDLQCSAYPNIFGAGDCVSIRHHRELPKAGVHAVRQANILAENLQVFLSGSGRLRRFKPRRAALSILSTGQREALLMYHGMAWHGRGAWVLKRWIDTRYVSAFKSDE